MDFKTIFDEFIINAEKAKAGNKAAGVRARKISLEIDEKLKAFRKESVQWAKEK